MYRNSICVSFVESDLQMVRKVLRLAVNNLYGTGFHHARLQTHCHKQSMISLSRRLAVGVSRIGKVSGLMICMESGSIRSSVQVRGMRSGSWRVSSSASSRECTGLHETLLLLEETLRDRQGKCSERFLKSSWSKGRSCSGGRKAK